MGSISENFVLEMGYTDVGRLKRPKADTEVIRILIIMRSSHHPQGLREQKTLGAQRGPTQLVGNWLSGRDARQSVLNHQGRRGTAGVGRRGFSLCWSSIGRNESIKEIPSPSLLSIYAVASPQ